METTKARTGSSEVIQRTSPVKPRTARSPRVSVTDSEPASSHSATRTPKDRSPKVIERRSPRNPVTEKKRPSKLSELESQVAQLQEELKAAKHQLSSSESCKSLAQQEAEAAKKQLVELNSKLEESQRQLFDLSNSEEARLHETEKISQEGNWSELEDQQSEAPAALASALNKIEKPKIQYEMSAESGTLQNGDEEVEIRSLQLKLSETLILVDNLKTQLRVSEEKEAQSQALVNDTLLDLETVKATAEKDKLDGLKTVEAYYSLSLELEKSRAKVTSLEELVSKLQLDLAKIMASTSGNDEHTQKTEDGELEKLNKELDSVKLESKQLGSALETTELRYREEQLRTTSEINTAHELVEPVKSEASTRETELVAELKRAKANIDELKAILMDKKTELQTILEENVGLKLQIVKNQSGEIQSELQIELKRSKEDVACLKACLMDKETEMQIVLEENEILKSEVKKNKLEESKVNDKTHTEAARASEQEALKKLGYAKLEADESSRRVTRVTEQLEAAQASNAEMEAELRRLKTQSDQWRKAAEAAAAVLSTGNNGRLMDRSGSIDSNFHPVTGKLSSPYSDMDDDSPKKKNGNMLKKFLWRRSQK